MKKFLLTLMALFLGFVLISAKKPNGGVTLVIESAQVGDSIVYPSNENTPHYTLFDVDSILQIRASDYLGDFVDIGLYNKSDQPIIIDWENARFNWSKVIFSTDRPITMDSQPKPQETVYPGRGTSSKQITGRSKYINGVWPLYDRDELKNGNPVPIRIEIPILLKNGEAKLYTFNMKFKWKYTY